MKRDTFQIESKLTFLGSISSPRSEVNLPSLREKKLMAVKRIMTTPQTPPYTRNTILVPGGGGAGGGVAGEEIYRDKMAHDAQINWNLLDS